MVPVEPSAKCKVTWTFSSARAGSVAGRTDSAYTRTGDAPTRYCSKSMKWHSSLRMRPPPSTGSYTQWSAGSAAAGFGEPELAPPMGGAGRRGGRQAVQADSPPAQVREQVGLGELAGADDAHAQLADGRRASGRWARRHRAARERLLDVVGEKNSQRARGGVAQQ